MGLHFGGQEHVPAPALLTGRYERRPEPLVRNGTRGERVNSFSAERGTTGHRGGHSGRHGISRAVSRSKRASVMTASPGNRARRPCPPMRPLLSVQERMAARTTARGPRRRSTQRSPQRDGHATLFKYQLINRAVAMESVLEKVSAYSHGHKDALEGEASILTGI